ncbi:MAG: UPF0182 family protein [Chloroflexota bacterium]
MSNNRDDIPEVFRRAMEEAGWDRDEDGNGSGEPPPLQNPLNNPRFYRLLVLIGLLLVLLLSFSWIVNTYTEWLWFNSVDYANVWIRQWVAWGITFLIAFAIAAGTLLINFHVARRRAIKDTSPIQNQLLDYRWVPWLLTAAALFLGFLFASTAGSNWLEFLRHTYRSPFGTSDPIFNLDVSFYLFSLPIYNFIRGWVLSLLFVTILGVLPIYAINNLADIQTGQWQPQKSDMIRRHIAFLGVIFLLFWAAGYIVDLLGLVFSPRGVVFGAGYTDLFASRWGLIAQFIFMVLAALSLFLVIFRVNFRPLLISAGLWFAATILISGLYPGILQRYIVEPNEIERETPYIAHNIEFTRLAFGLDKIKTQPFTTEGSLNDQNLALSQEVLDTIRLWDYRPLESTYEQLQALRPYYEFSGIDIDRYEIDGETRQVMLAARELDKSKLAAPSWVNLNLEFTHGYGIVMNPVDRFTPDGQPEFFIKDLPPNSEVEFEVERPEIYYGERTNDVVYVGSAREEFSYPSGNDNVYTRYGGVGGVLLDSFFKRAAFALRFSDANVLLSDEVDSDTRVMLHRQIQTRVSHIAPFLFLDGDPYLVVANGRLVWMLDAYTISGSFPYSAPTVRGFNYIRNASKITVDAYDGNVNFYFADTEDPLIQAYSQAFPGMFQPLSAMPQELFDHIRYPEDLFRVQTTQYLTYHMQDVRVFYNKEDLWELPTEIISSSEQNLEPYYVILPLPGETESEYLLIQPYTPAEKNNMVAWLAARNDGENYGELIAYELPKQELIFGPIQIEGRIDQEPEISQQFSLWDQRGSQVIRGNLLVVPFEDSFLYVEPVYLLSETSALPELKRVIVANNSEVAMEETLEQALVSLIQGDADEVIAGEAAQAAAEERAAAQAAQTAVSETTSEETAAEETSEGSATITIPEGSITGSDELDILVENLISSANDHFLAAEQAQRDGDWAKYGEELQALQEDLQLLTQLTATVEDE